MKREEESRRGGAQQSRHPRAPVCASRRVPNRLTSAAFAGGEKDIRQVIALGLHAPHQVVGIERHHVTGIQWPL